MSVYCCTKLLFCWMSLCLCDCYFWVYVTQTNAVRGQKTLLSGNRTKNFIKFLRSMIGSSVDHSLCFRCFYYSRLKHAIVTLKYFGTIKRTICWIFTPCCVMCLFSCLGETCCPRLPSEFGLDDCWNIWTFFLFNRQIIFFSNILAFWWTKFNRPEGGDSTLFRNVRTHMLHYVV